MTRMVIKLTPWEMLLAAQAGIMRQVDNLHKKRQAYYGAGTVNDWQLHVEGCLGEYALAKYLGVNWSGQGFRGGDVGAFEVRTRSKDYYELILHPDDHDEKHYWLLCGCNGTYTIKGWILGRDGKRKDYWKDPAGGRPAFFVPQSALILPEEQK
jgi:hypothetical protein